jgi:flagellar motility protein MotE (MotC chaperone)
MMLRKLSTPQGTLILLVVALAPATLLPAGTALAPEQSEQGDTGQPDEQPTDMTTAIDTQTPDARQEPLPENIADREVLLFLENLRRREREVEVREQALQNELQALASITAELETRHAELQVIRDEINQQLLAVDNARATRITALGKWYAAMEPTEAANQLSTQEIDTIVDVFLTMEERKASAVLESMQVDVAAQVVEEMSRRN